MNTIHVILSCVANLDRKIHHLDVKNAFLHGDLKQELYMEIPLGFEDARTVSKVCSLRRSLYELKQSSRAWFDIFKLALVRFGYDQSGARYALFIRR